MARFYPAALALTLLLGTSNAAYCGGAPDPNAQPNAYPISTKAPTLLRSVKNGHAYVAGETAPFYVVHLYGSAYEMGYAQGQLFPAETQEMLNRTWCVWSLGGR